MRIGHGYDVHRFSTDPGRPLWLGLVKIEGSPGLFGHSDADVVVHALCDAMLGAANLGDLGTHFPDDDPATAGVPSATLLARVVELVHAASWRVESADVTVVAEHPHLAPHRGAMGLALSAATGCSVSVKATTAEGLGSLGRGDGIAATAVVLLAES
jgi:2-C-methyl-D-erythritol 2,4-cyclodiphosphate synthase